MDDNLVLGIDIGGSSVKGGVVDVSRGSMASDRFEIPHHPLPKLTVLTSSICEIQKKSGYEGNQVGIGFPGVVSSSKVFNGPNIDEGVWGTVLRDSLGESGLDGTLLNDADAALYHAIRNTEACVGQNTVLMITIGTSIGTALAQDGILVRNLELGRIYDADGYRIDESASQRSRLANNMSTDDWIRKLSSAILQVSLSTNPDMILLGGGVTESPQGWFDRIQLGIPIQIAPGSNRAGLIGAACWHRDVNRKARL
jgi:polyphosphate glucokinase